MVLQPMREAILAWSLFHGKADGIQQTEKNMDRTMHRSINVKKGYSGKECIVDKKKYGTDIVSAKRQTGSRYYFMD